MRSSHLTELHFASFFSGGFVTIIVVNPPEKKTGKMYLFAPYVPHELLENVRSFFKSWDIREN
jgi:hypothetical protein